MATLVRELSTPMLLGDRVYRAEVWGDRRDDGLWDGWVEFAPVGEGVVLSTGRETSQSNFEALAYWASGLQPVYLDGALARAIEKSPHAA